MSKRIFETTPLGFDDDDVAKLTPHQSSELEACKRSFRRFLCYWHFRNCETGEIRIVGGNRWGRALVLLSRGYLGRGA